METKNNNVNNNINNVTVQVQFEQPKKKITKKKKEPTWYKKWLLGLVGTVVVAVSIPYVTAEINVFFRDAKDKKIIEVLNQYADGLNTNTFDAYKYFSPRVERFYQMLNTDPKEINSYVNGLYKKQYKKATMYFDESTMVSEKIANEEYKVSVIMYSTCFDVMKQKQFDDFRTRIELVFDKNFRMKFFRQFYD
jgi:hypothetical protein